MSAEPLRVIQPPPKLAFQAPFTPGPAPMLQWVDIASLVVDDTYQRPIEQSGQANVRRIGENFVWSNFAPLIVAPIEGGRFAVIDGQHRATAAMARGLETLPAMVVIADRARQAESFAAVNGAVTRMTAQQLFFSQLAAGNTEAQTINAICTLAGVRIVRGNAAASVMKPEDTMAVQALRSALKRNGEAILETALRVIVASARRYSRGGVLAGPTIQAVTETLSMFPDWAELGDVLIAEFRKIDLLPLLRDARAHHALNPGVATWQALSNTLVTLLEAQLANAPPPGAEAA